MLVDANQHVDREGAGAPGVGFYGKNTMLITRGTAPGSSSARSSPTSRSSRRAPLDARLRPLHGSASTPARRARSTSRVCSTRPAASRTGRRHPRRSRRHTATELGASVYGCDICQDVCPWNRGVEKRRAGVPRAPTTPCRTSRSSTGSTGDGDELVGELDRLYVPRNDPRWLRRNALAPLGNTGAATPSRSSRQWARATIRCSPTRRVGARADRGAAAMSGRRSARRARARAAEPGGGAGGDRRGLRRTPTTSGGGGCSSSPAPPARASNGSSPTRAASLRSSALDVGDSPAMSSTRRRSTGGASSQRSRPGSRSTATRRGCGRRSTT